MGEQQGTATARGAATAQGTATARGAATARGTATAQGAATAQGTATAREEATILDAEPVPHAAPFAADTSQPDGDDELNQQITDAFGELIRYAHDVGQAIAVGFGLSGSEALSLFKLEAPMTMKELGLRMGCDPSFVTSVADGLEKHGLARREPSQRDRRSKNIVLTPEGVKARDRICSELAARAPWCTTLDTSERRCLLGLMKKMLGARDGR